MIRDSEDTKYSPDHTYHILRGPQLDEETVCVGYAVYLEYFKALRVFGKGTRYLFTKFFRCGCRTYYHYYLREVVEHAKGI